jgi:hypothetical protein
VSREIIAPGATLETAVHAFILLVLGNGCSRIGIAIEIGTSVSYRREKKRGHQACNPPQDRFAHPFPP